MFSKNKYFSASVDRFVGLFHQSEPVLGCFEQFSVQVLSEFDLVCADELDLVCIKYLLNKVWFVLDFSGQLKQSRTSDSL